ncbi:MAG: 50S ribosomal protein L10 [Phototrophicaceae bacterium]
MAITRVRKEELVSRYLEILSRSDGIILAQYKAMTVAEAEQLRHKVREVNAEYMVTKNTLLKIALQEMGWSVPEGMLQGSVGVIFSQGDIPKTAQAVIDFAKLFSEKFVPKGGVLGGSSIFQASELEAIVKMPSREQLLAQVLGLLTQPSSQLVGTIDAAVGGVVNVLHPATAGMVNLLSAQVNKLENPGEAA